MTIQKSKEDVRRCVAAACAAMDEKFGQCITALDIGDISSLADFFVIVTGLNNPQTQSMTEACVKACRASGFPLVSSEGEGTGWLLMDFGDIIVHVFDAELRRFYNLERIWADAKDCADITGALGKTVRDDAPAVRQ